MDVCSWVKWFSGVSRGNQTDNPRLQESFCSNPPEKQGRRAAASVERSAAAVVSCLEIKCWWTDQNIIQKIFWISLFRNRRLKIFSCLLLRINIISSLSDETIWTEAEETNVSAPAWSDLIIIHRLWSEDSF